jgi:hypothetical protein
MTERSDKSVKTERGNAAVLLVLLQSVHTQEGRHIGESGMRALERLLVKFTMFLCNVLDVTPDHLETLRQKRRRPLRREERFDHFEA